MISHTGVTSGNRSQAVWCISSQSGDQLCSGISWWSRDVLPTRSLTLFLLPFSYTSDSISVDLTLPPTPPLLCSNALKPHLSLLFISLHPPPLQRLNPPSVPTGSLNYSLEDCSPQRPVSDTQTQKEGKSHIERQEGGGARAIEWWQQMSGWELPRKPHTDLPPLPPFWQPLIT